MLLATIIYCWGGVAATLITIRWAYYWDEGNPWLVFFCSILIGVLWPIAAVVYLKDEAP